MRASHSPFVAACGGGPIVAFALEDPERWEGALRLAGAERRALPARAALGRRPGRRGRRLRRRRVDARLPGGARGWRAPADLPFAGFSAGAAVAAARAIVGGWRLGDREVCAEEAGEDLDELAVRDGLGLVPFAVDVHATQWGTLTRLVHAVGAGLVDEGWAIDEGTVLVVDDGAVRVEGLGSAYRVAPRDGAVVVSVQP